MKLSFMIITYNVLLVSSVKTLPMPNSDNLLRGYQIYMDGDLIETIIEDHQDDEWLENIRKIPVYFDENSFDFGIESALLYIFDFFRKNGETDPLIIVSNREDDEDFIFIHPTLVETERGETYILDNKGDGCWYFDDEKEEIESLEKTIKNIKEDKDPRHQGYNIKDLIINYCEETINSLNS